ncbi:hypothetical protein [Buttiauxella brennerae]|uniref:hypothetical protein n=1 Tax=Buttiauxella brennerae TaxID=82988 RepID=UPI00286F53F5|nr:hypothetical protein [Buttiauxella brennerae]
MGVVSSNFKASVTFGGVVSNSFKSSTATLMKSIQGAEAESAKLAKQQENLTRKIKAGVLAGKDVSRLKRQYEDLGKSIRQATGDEALFNKALKARNLWAKPLKGLGRHTGLTGMGQGVAERLGGIRDKGIVPSMLSTVGGATGGLGALIAGSIGGALAVNAGTAEQVGVARSYGVNLNTFKTWDALGKQMGLSGENIGDLGEELANKVGEFKALGKQSSVSDAFQMLGLTSADLSGKTNQEQLALVMERALKVGDEQVARSAVDMIAGGEGNKILTYLKQSGKTYEQLMAAQQKYILTTDEGAEGAVRGQTALSNMWSALSSAAQEVIGTLAGELAPSITQYADEFANWFSTGGKQEMTGGIKGFATSLQDFWSSQLSPVLSSLWQGLQVLAEKIEEWFPSVDTEVRRAKTGEEAYQIGWRESEESQKKYAENRGEDFVFDPGKARQDALVMMQKWEGIKSEQLFERATPLDEIPVKQTSDEKLLSFLNYTQAPAAPTGATQATDLTPRQHNTLNITVQAAPGNDAKATGDIVAGRVFNVLNPLAGGNSIVTPATPGG